MAFSSVPLLTTGDWIDAAWGNTYWRDNFTAVWPYTTAGDIGYATGATNMTRLGIGGSGQYLTSTGSAPQWAKLTRYMGFLLNTTVALSAGDNAARFRIPSAMNGWNITSVAASRQSGTGTVQIQIRNVTDAVDVLTLYLTIDSGETDSSTAASPAVINTSNDDVATADQFAIDIDGAGTSTLFLFVEIGFQTP